MCWTRSPRSELPVSTKETAEPARATTVLRQNNRNASTAARHAARMRQITRDCAKFTETGQFHRDGTVGCQINREERQLFNREERQLYCERSWALATSVLRWDVGIGGTVVRQYPRPPQCSTEKPRCDTSPVGVQHTANTGWVSVGTEHDTAASAVAPLRRWWDTTGRRLPAR